MHNREETTEYKNNNDVERSTEDTNEVICKYTLQEKIGDLISKYLAVAA